MNSPTANNSCSGFFIRIKKGREQKMVKISFIASGIILGLATISSASASIISRSFLDQALTDYATTTALDLKADKADVTDLSDKIGGAWPYVREMSPGLNSLSLGLYPIEINLENASDLVRFLFGGRIESGIDQGGVLSILGQSVLVSGAYDVNTGQIDDGFRSLLQLTDGWTDSESKTYLGVKGLNDKIGTLPSGDMRPSKGLAFLVPSPAYTYPTTIGDSIFQLYSGTLGLSGLADAVYHGNTFMGQTDTTLQVKGLRQITDEIGTLPSGSLLNQTPFTDDLYKSTQGTESPVYPNSMAELVKQIYGEFSSSGNQPGLVHLLITGFPHNGGLPINSDFIGILPAMSLAENANSVANTANETAQANTAKIGTLPTEIVIGNSNGSIDMFNITKRQSVSLPKDYTLSDFIQDMYYGSFGVNAGLDSSPFYGLSDIIDHVMYGGITGEASPLTDKQYKGLIDLTLEINKIGDLPSGEFPEFPGSEFLFPWLNQPLTYPTSLAELITAIYGNSETGVGLLAAIITGFPVDRDGDGGTDEYAGLLPNLDLTKDAIDLANANATKIGTVPDGKNLAGMISETDAKIGAISPNTTVADLISKTNAKFGVLPPDTTVAGMIGTLPDEYSTVGAALTAMKSDIDAKNLPSTSDDGQYVLSAKKVGDTITYTWVKMDLTNEEQAQ